MEQLKELQQINPWIIIGALITILLFWSFIQELLEKTFGKLIRKFGIKFETKGMRQRREDHELLIKVSENLVKLQERHESDEKEFRNNLNNYMAESRKDRKSLHDEMKQYSTNRVNDRQQSLQIQKELKDSISSRDVQIESLVIANKELLAEKINEKYKYYLSIQGIPADEYDEFVNLHTAYKGCGGNSLGDAKFEYCMEHLQIIPVETKLVIKHEN